MGLVQRGLYIQQMNKSDFAKLCERVQRSHDAIYDKASSGFVQSQKHRDGSSTQIEIVGIKAPERLEDELLNLFIWLWSMKDYLKTLCENRGIAGSRIEQIVNVERPLSIAADIANRAKHGVLRESRSGDFAKLQNVMISIPQSSLASISFDKPAVRITVDTPEDAELWAEIGFESGLTPVDAFQTATQAFTAWQVHAFPSRMFDKEIATKPSTQLSNNCNAHIQLSSTSWTLMEFARLEQCNADVGAGCLHGDCDIR